MVLSVKNKHSSNIFLSLIIVLIFLLYAYLIFTFLLNFYNKKEGFINPLKNNKMNNEEDEDDDDEDEY